jgi:hypothetical protein
MPIETNFGIDKEAFDRQIRLYVSENNRKRMPTSNHNI